jgi:hypothetical protein
MVRWEGVEPPTLWFVARCSIQLSYQRAERPHYSDNTGRSPEGNWVDLASVLLHLHRKWSLPVNLGSIDHYMEIMGCFLPRQSVTKTGINDEALPCKKCGGSDVDHYFV